LGYKQGGDRTGKKYITLILDVNKAGNSISEGFRGIGQKLSEILTYLYFVGTFFFLFCFRLIEPMRIFFKFFSDNLWTNYHVILPYLDAFDTYIVTRA